MGRGRAGRLFPRVRKGSYRLSILLPWAVALLPTPLAQAQEQIIWEAPAMTGWREADSVEVHGRMENGVFHPDSIAIPQHSGNALPALIHLDENIIDSAQIRPFGVEERVQARKVKQGIAIECGLGDAPAGLVLRWPGFRFPIGFGGRWNMEGGATAAIGVSVVKAGDDAPSEAVEVLTRDGLSLPFQDIGAQQALILTCPAQGASGLLESVRLVSAESSRAATPRGTWIWQEQLWRAAPEKFANAAVKAGFNELAIQVPTVPDEALARLAKVLDGKGITLRLVDGDPSMATAEGLQKALARLDRLRRWSATYWRTGNQPVLELDIEPYGEARFAADPAAGWRGWAEAVRKLAVAWGHPVVIDVPWWMLQSEAGAAALQIVRPSVQEIVVMAYRTEPQLILDAAEPWLATGARVQVAIETGPVANEVTRTYRRAKRGALRLSDGNAKLFQSVQEAAPGEVAYELAVQNIVKGDRVSFFGALDRALEVERKLNPVLKGWTGYNGFRLHGWPMAAPEIL